jgi:hypothetical protein
MSNDIIDIANNEDWEVWTPTGWQPFKGVSKIKRKQLYRVTTDKNKTVLCSSKHSFIDENGNKLLCKDSLNKKIKTKDGLEVITSITKCKKGYTYDLLDVQNGNVFYANHILHHNTHILEEFWASVIPAISSGKTSKIFMVSTPNGVANKFYEIYSSAESNPNKKWKTERIDWFDVPDRDEAWKSDMVAALGSEEKFLQEFGNCFLDDASCAVGALVIEKFKLEKTPPVWISDDGEYQVFEFPDTNKIYAIGVDVGEGIGRASSVAQILDVTDLKNINQVAVYGSAVIEPYHFANKLNVIGHSWGLPPILIERNNCGAQVIDALYHNHSYEKLVSYNKISEKDQYNRTRNLGVLSHTNIKFDGIQNMRYWVNHLQTVKVNDPQTISEFETFVRHPNGVYRKRSDNYFDDRIMALVWALFILEPTLCQQYFTIEEYDNQLKPLKIVSNDYWEKDVNAFQLKDLSKNPNAIPHSNNIENSIDIASPSLGTGSEIFKDLDKYDLDVESLFEQGYEFLNLDSQ